MCTCVAESAGVSTSTFIQALSDAACACRRLNAISPELPFQLRDAVERANLDDEVLRSFQLNVGIQASPCWFGADSRDCADGQRARVLRRLRPHRYDRALPTACAKVLRDAESIIFCLVCLQSSLRRLAAWRARRTCSSATTASLTTSINRSHQFVGFTSMCPCGLLVVPNALSLPFVSHGGVCYAE